MKRGRKVLRLEVSVAQMQHIDKEMNIFVSIGRHLEKQMPVEFFCPAWNTLRCMKVKSFWPEGQSILVYLH